MEAVFAQYHPTMVVHFAAESHVDRSIDGPDVFVRTNVLGTQVLLDVARKQWQEDACMDTARFLYISTDEVYGDLPLESTEKFTEGSPIKPSSPYSVSKAAGDLMAQAYHRTYGMPTLITRSSNNYGPRQYPEKLIPLTIKKALAGEPSPSTATASTSATGCTSKTTAAPSMPSCAGASPETSTTSAGATS